MTKKEMARTIEAANKRMQRLRKKGYTHSQEYARATAAISRANVDNPFEKKRITLNPKKTQTYAEMQRQYRAARQIMKKPELTVRAVEVEINTKRVYTFETEHGIKIRNRQKFFDLLKSDEFKQASEEFSSNQVLIAVKEAYNGGMQPGAIKKKLQKFMKNAEKHDAYYIEDLEDLF